MSIENAVIKRADLLSLGKSALNARYPKEFELYVCALELTDIVGRTLRYFIFPVNPSQLEETQPEITNIKKTLAGITTLSTTTFVPVDITLTGTFGRKFRILLGTDFVDFISSFQDNEGKLTTNSFQKGLANVFDQRIKTGYGTLKILEDIIKESNVVDENGPRRLIFYNPAFGTSYIVKPMSFKIQQAQENNMLHSYYLQLKGIAPLDALRSTQDLQSEAMRLNSTAYVQKQTDQLVKNLTSILK